MAQAKSKAKPKKKSGQKPGRTKIDRSADKIKALELRILGLSYREIAVKLDCSPAMAFNYVSSCIKEQQREPALNLIQIELGRLDEMLFALQKAVLSGNTKAIDTALRIQERRAKLLGLDAPKRVDVGVSGSDDSWRDGIEDLRNDKDTRASIVEITMKLAKKKKEAGNGMIKVDR